MFINSLLEQGVSFLIFGRKLFKRVDLPLPEQKKRALSKLLAVYRAEVFYRSPLAVLRPVRTVQRDTLSVSYESYRTLMNLFGMKVENRLQYFLKNCHENT